MTKTTINPKIDFDPDILDQERIEIFMDPNKLKAEVDLRAKLIEEDLATSNLQFGWSDYIITIIIAVLLPTILLFWTWITKPY